MAFQVKPCIFRKNRVEIMAKYAKNGANMRIIYVLRELKHQKVT